MKSNNIKMRFFPVLAILIIGISGRLAEDVTPVETAAVPPVEVAQVPAVEAATEGSAAPLEGAAAAAPLEGAAEDKTAGAVAAPLDSSAAVASPEAAAPQIETPVAVAPAVENIGVKSGPNGEPAGSVRHPPGQGAFPGGPGGQGHGQGGYPGGQGGQGQGGYPGGQGGHGAFPGGPGGPGQGEGGFPGQGGQGQGGYPGGGHGHDQGGPGQGGHDHGGWGGGKRCRMDEMKCSRFTALDCQSREWLWTKCPNLCLTCKCSDTDPNCPRYVDRCSETKVRYSCREACGICISNHWGGGKNAGGMPMSPPLGHHRPHHLPHPIPPLSILISD